MCYCSWLKGKAIIGTASNDKTARIWQADGKNCLLKYLGHSGSVNSIRLVTELVSCIYPLSHLGVSTAKIVIVLLVMFSHEIYSVTVRSSERG